MEYIIVLILFFDGNTLFNINNGSTASQLTVGKSITFQLCRNMLNNSYKGLQN